MSPLIERTDHREPLLSRLGRALGPIGAGLMLDLLDLATFGPIGLLGGFLLGGLLGWWLGTLYEFSQRGRLVLAVVAALYMAIPLTEPLPIATAVGAFARFRERPRVDRNASDDEKPVPDTHLLQKK